MKRRQLLLGSGATLGGASILGTGAFTSVRAERSVTVNVAADADAFLRLAPCDENGGYVTDADSGTIAIDLSGSNDNVGGSGVNPEARSVFDNVFEIANQGTQDVCVDFEVEVPQIPSDASVPERYEFGSGDPAVVFYRGSDRNRYVINNRLDTDRDGAIKLPIDEGNAECIGFEVRAFGFDSDEDLFSGVDLTIRADADAECAVGGGFDPADPVPTSPVGYWPLDDFSDGITPDVVGSADGRINGDISATNGFSSVAQFNGEDDYIDCSNVLDLTDSYTLSAIVDPSEQQKSYTRIISREQSGQGNRQYNMISDQSGRRPRSAVDTIGRDNVVVEGDNSDTITQNRPHHLAVTFDSTDALRLYLNGEEIDSESVSAPVVSRQSGLYFGTVAHKPGDRLYNGFIYDIRIYDRALSAEEIDGLGINTSITPE